MKRYAVEWTPAADAALADIWLQSADPAAVTQAAHRIENTLEQNPLGHGIEVNEGLRRIVDPPLAVWYSVDAASQQVLVEAVIELQ